jgi:uncharacterized membrane protein (UPF0127 family)
VIATAVALIIALPTGSSTALGARTNAVPRLLLDSVRFRPELALTSEQRSTGLMHRLKAPADGMLFVFPQDTTSGFWMKNTLVPLKIVFFDGRGSHVRTLSMKPCRRDPCSIYSPNRVYRFALELRTTDTRPAKRLGPLSELRRLTDRAS